MSISCGTRPALRRHGERGEGRLKFIIVVAVIAIVAYCAYQYVPVTVQAYQFKDVMQQTVNSAAMQQTTNDGLRKLLTDRAQEYGAPPPPATQVEVTQVENRWQARVHYTRDISFPFYTYQYIFDNTVKSFDPTTMR